MYVVIAYRWGERGNHSYTLGIFDKKMAAIKCAESHTKYRGGKYGCVVEAFNLNEYIEDENPMKEIHRTKSLMEYGDF